MEHRLTADARQGEIQNMGSTLARRAVDAKLQGSKLFLGIVPQIAKLLAQGVSLLAGILCCRSECGNADDKSEHRRR